MSFIRRLADSSFFENSFEFNSRDDDIGRLARVIREVERAKKAKIPDYSIKSEKCSEPVMAPDEVCAKS